MKFSSDIVNTMTVSDEINKIATVSNNPLQFKIPGYVLSRSENAHDVTRAYDVTDKESFTNVKAWMNEIDKHVSDGVNKLHIENKCDLTSQEELSTDEAKEEDSLNLKLRDEFHERGMRYK